MLVVFDLQNESFFFLIFCIFFGSNLRFKVCEKLVISPKMFIINHNVIITLIIIIITIIINIISFVTVFTIVLFVRQRGANHAPEASVTQVNQSVHTKHLPEDSYRSQHVDLMGLFHSRSP